MRALLSLLLLPAFAGGQMQLPPGTTSVVPNTRVADGPNAQAEALRRAEDAISAGAFQDAVGLLKPLTDADQKNSRAFYDLGFAQDALGHDEAAAAAYKTAANYNPNDVAARVSLGLLLARTEHRADAESQLEAAVAVVNAPPDLLGRAYRALAQMHLDSKPAQAADELVDALKVSAETPEDAALAAEIADAQHDDAAAEKAYMHAQVMAPADAEVALGYARLLSRAKKHAAAEAALDAARKAHPENRALLAEYASQELLQNHTAQVLPMLQKLHQSQPADPAIARLLASSYVATGEPAKAEPIYLALLKAAPEDPGVQVEWADCLIRQKRSPEAQPVLQHVVFGNGGAVPKDVLASAAGMLAFAASTNHDAETVLKALSIRDTLISSSAVYTFLAAGAHDTLHHTKQAAEQYRMFLQQAGGKFPDQEWQAQQRLQILDRSK